MLGSLSSISGGRLKLDPGTKAGDCDFESVFSGAGYVTEKFFALGGFENRP